MGRCPVVCGQHPVRASLCKGYPEPRRNGKNEVVLIRELHGLTHGERVLHTAHRTTTSSSASKRLAAVLDAAGYTEVIRAKKDEKYDKHYTDTKQLGLERITLLGDGGGTVDFRTRSSKGGLGEGFDLLIIDEAQEYTDDQESALKYVVSDSKNPQTLFCGTPPTPTSSGTFFLHLRNNALHGETVNTGWAEWSVEQMTDPRDREACDGFPVEPNKLLIEQAEIVREHFGAPVHVSSGVRCARHNAAVGGVDGSRHKTGKAMDFRVEGHGAAEVLAFVKTLPNIRYAYAIDGSYVHTDVA